LKDERLIEKFGRYFVLPSPRVLRKIDTELIIEKIYPSVTGFLEGIKRPERITVCVTDNTRPFPEKKILPHILKSLKKLGIEKSRITILVATGLHRHLTTEELISKFGNAIVKNYRIIQNDPYDSVLIKKNFSVNRVLTESDAILGTGVFEPHQYAGFSGGNKIFIVGCGGRETIDYTHSPDMVMKRGVRLGNTLKNPFRKHIEDFAGYLPPRWVVNIVMNQEGDIVSFSAGAPEKVFATLSEWYLQNLTFSFNRRYDAAFVKISQSKGINLYQASRGATYLALSESPVIKCGAPIIVEAGLEEGFGGGEGEREFFRILSSPLNNRSLLWTLRSAEIRGGGQRAIMLLLALLRHHIIFTGYRKNIILQRENLYFVRDPADAIDMAISRFGCRKMLYIKNPFSGLFNFSEEKRGD